MHIYFTHWLEKSKVLILDLDETLIHTCTIRDSPDVILSYSSIGGETNKVIFVNDQ
jgi:predicted HAD superfamily phosphohydrolase YqeG